MKKKICLISIIGLALLSGCSKGYKEGVYTGTAIDSYGGQNNTATAIVTVDKNGMTMKGTSAEFMPPTPQDLGMPDEINSFPLVSSIKDFSLSFK